MDSSLRSDLRMTDAKVEVREDEADKAVLAHLVYNAASMFTDAESNGDRIDVKIDGVKAEFYVYTTETSINGGPSAVLLLRSGDADVCQLVLLEQNGWPRKWNVRQSYWTSSSDGEFRVADLR